MKESSHWYDPITGEARHTIIGAKGQERATTLRDARKFGWLPSVTTIFKVLAAPELDKWKQKQILLQVLKTPKIEGEAEEDFMNRIMEDAFVQVTDAADLGTSVHAAIENHYQGHPFDENLKEYVESFDKWAKENKVTFVEQEKRIVCPKEGYAGTTDGIVTVEGRMGFGVLDIKTRKSKPEFKMTPWQKEPMQIAAYGKGLAGKYEISYGVNVFVSTTEPGRVESAWYESDQLEREYQTFLNTIKIWQHFNNYVPNLVDNPANS